MNPTIKPIQIVVLKDENAPRIVSTQVNTQQTQLEANRLESKHCRSTLQRSPFSSITKLIIRSCIYSRKNQLKRSFWLFLDQTGREISLNEAK